MTFFRTYRMQYPNPIYGRQGQKPYRLRSKWHLLAGEKKHKTTKVNPDWRPYDDKPGPMLIEVEQMTAFSSCGLLVIPSADAQFASDLPSKANQMCWGCFTVYRSGV